MTAAVVTPGLYMGSAPPLHQDWSMSGVKHLVLAAAELHHAQKPEYYPGVHTYYVPLSDDYNKPMPPAETAVALEAAANIASWVSRGEMTVVTCHEGRNRSGLLTALSLMLLARTSPEQAVHLVRAARGELALQNPQFLKLLNSTGAAAQTPMAS